MISGASEKELDIAIIRADIMIALNEKYGNYDLLNKLDKYQENEKQQLIKFLEDKIKEIEEKNKVINEILKLDYDCYCPYERFCDEEQDECDKVKKLCDCENCQDDYKKCWLKYFENKIKEVKK